jgi:hypothetical protein
MTYLGGGIVIIVITRVFGHTCPNLARMQCSMRFTSRNQEGACRLDPVAT